jgi:hypothetical protein
LGKKYFNLGFGINIPDPHSAILLTYLQNKWWSTRLRVLVWVFYFKKALSSTKVPVALHKYQNKRNRTADSKKLKNKQKLHPYIKIGKPIIFLSKQYGILTVTR